MSKVDELEIFFSNRRKRNRYARRGHQKASKVAHARPVTSYEHRGRTPPARCDDCGRRAPYFRPDGPVNDRKLYCEDCSIQRRISMAS